MLLFFFILGSRTMMAVVDTKRATQKVPSLTTFSNLENITAWKNKLISLSFDRGVAFGISCNPLLHCFKFRNRGRSKQIVPKLILRNLQKVSWSHYCCGFRIVTLDSWGRIYNPAILCLSFPVYTAPPISALRL